jgi:hypothetical protein
MCVCGGVRYLYTSSRCIARFRTSSASAARTAVSRKFVIDLKTSANSARGDTMSEMSMSMWSAQVPVTCGRVRLHKVWQ